MDELGNLRPFFPCPPGGGNIGEGEHNGNFGPLPMPGPVLHGAAVGQPGWAYDGWGLGPGFGAYYLGFDLFPFPPLPTFPIIIDLTDASTVSPCPIPNRSPLLALPWYDDKAPPPPPPSSLEYDPQPQDLPASLAPAPAWVPRGRCPKAMMPPKHSSPRLAAMETQEFVPMVDKAIQCKALRESLAACSATLKKQVVGRKLLKRKNPMGALDLGWLARAARLSCTNCHAVAVAATGAGVAP